MAPSYGPYPMDGTVYDIDGTTAVAGATIIALDVTTGEKTSVISDSAGNFVIDLANLASGYTNADKIQITAKYTTNANTRSLSRRHTVNTIIGIYNIGNMVLHPGDDMFGTCYVQYAGAANKYSASLIVDYYDRKNDVLQFSISSLATTTFGHQFGYIGLLMEGGFIRVYSDETAGRIIAVTTVK